MTNQQLPLQQLEPEDRPLFRDSKSRPVTTGQLALATFTDFLYWWYIQMPLFIILTIRRTHVVLNDKLSIGMLIKNFFTPWQRRYNLTYVIIGVIMKATYLPFAIAGYLIVILTQVLLLVTWLALPILTLVFLVLTPLIKR